MDTNELIKALAADTQKPEPSLSSVWWRAAGLAITLAAAVFFVTLGPRPDIAAAAETPRFLFKFVVTITLAVECFRPCTCLSRPGEAWREATRYLAAAPALMAMAVVVELFLLPPETWMAKLIGTNSMVCLTFIPLIGIGPLVIFLFALRHGAPDAAGPCRGGRGAACGRHRRHLLRRPMHR